MKTQNYKEKFKDTKYSELVIQNSTLQTWVTGTCRQQSRMPIPLVWSMKKMWFLKPMMRSPVLLRKQAADRDLSWKALLLSSPSSSTVFLPCSSTLIFFLPGSSCKMFSSISNLSIKISVTRCLFSSQILITPFKLKVHARSSLFIIDWTLNYMILET